MNIAVVNRQRTRKINLRLLEKITNALLTELEIEKAEIGICLAVVPEMTRLNETFLKHKGSTDVIAFDYRDSVGQASSLSHSKIRKVRDRQDACSTLQGEIFICVDEAVLQARKFGTSWQSEVIRYMVHGVLHLLGFDDSNAGARRKMKREENRRLREIAHRFPLSKL
jgi:probable rRNA maturation factor